MLRLVVSHTLVYDNCKKELAASLPYVETERSVVAVTHFLSQNNKYSGRA